MTDMDGNPPHRRPPRKGQFQPGKSGNPRGRPKGAKNVRTLVEEQLAVKVTVVENGRSREISKREVMVLQLVNKATTGDLKSIAAVLDMTRDHDEDLPNAGLSVLARAEDSAVMDAIIARIRVPATPDYESADPGERAPDDPSTGDAGSIDDDPSSTGDA
jgi:hypothetical protein